MTTGQRIKAARKKANMTQADLAAKLGIPYQSIGQWERDIRNPKHETVQRIANALNISILELLDPTSYNAGFDDGVKAEEWSNYLIDELWKDEGYTHSDIECQLINAFSTLNEKGQAIAVERIEELTKIPDYQRNEDPTEDKQTPQSGNSEEK